MAVAALAACATPAAMVEARASAPPHAERSVGPTASADQFDAVMLTDAIEFQRVAVTPAPDLPEPLTAQSRGGSFGHFILKLILTVSVAGIAGLCWREGRINGRHRQEMEGAQDKFCRDIIDRLDAIELALRGAPDTPGR